MTQAVRPEAGDPELAEFARIIRAMHEIRPARGVAPVVGALADEHELLEVPVRDHGYPALACWFNAIEHALEHGGRAVYGWGIWRIAGGHRFLANHHAVWQAPDGHYEDVTPNDAGVESIIFMPDHRSPFDLDVLKRPLDMQWRPGTPIVLWSMHDGTFESQFTVAKHEPCNAAESERIERLRRDIRMRPEASRT